jgi:hypothetical protein
MSTRCFVGHGWMISDGSSVLGIDEQLIARTRYLWGGEPVRVEDVVLLDDHRWVVAIANQAYLVDLAQTDHHIPLAPWFGQIQYERTTHLMAIPSGRGQWIGRYDPKTGEFRDRLEVHYPDWIELLDPAVNQGNVARKIVADGTTAPRTTATPATTATITAIRGIDFTADQPFREAPSFKCMLPEAIARALSVRTAWNPQPYEIAAAVAAQLPAVARHRTSPDGSLIATAAGGRITLRDREGHVQWATALPGAIDVAWSGSGDLIAFGSGMARVDLTTGAPLDRRCGWEFGLWEVNEATFEFGARLCEAP